MSPGNGMIQQYENANTPLVPSLLRFTRASEGPFGSRTAIAAEQVHHNPGAPSRIVLPCRLP